MIQTDDITTRLVHPADGGATMTLLGVTVTTRVAGMQGAFALIEYTLPPHFDGFAPHWHAHTTEVYYVLRGTLACTLGDVTLTASQGTSILAPPRLLHTIWNPTPAPVMYLLWCSPGGFERYLAEVATLLGGDAGWSPATASRVAALAVAHDVWLPAPVRTDSDDMHPMEAANGHAGELPGIAL